MKSWRQKAGAAIGGFLAGIVVLLLLVGITSCQETPSFPENSSPVTQFRGNQMTIDYVITVGTPLEKEARGAVEKVINETFAHVHAVYNNWNPKSELSFLNQLPANQKVPLSPELEKLLRITDKAFIATEGRFDPTIEPLRKLWKLSLEKGEVPTDEAIDALEGAIGWHKVHFGDGFFWKENSALQLDLGGVAKGYCVDLLVEALQEIGYSSLFVDWGGDIRTAGSHPDERPWRILIRNPTSADPQDDPIEILETRDQALATSGDYWQFWTVGDTTYFHIIDPNSRRALQTQALTSISVLASTCAEADALATAGMLFEGPQDAKKWTEELRKGQPELAFWLVSRI